MSKRELEGVEVEPYRPLLVCPEGELMRRGKWFYAHLTNADWKPACGLAAGDGWRIEASSKVPNWGALLCPRCRLLLDEELVELAREYRQGLCSKPPATGRGRS